MAYGRKFNADDIRAIRQQHADGVPITQIAIAYNVNRETIERILSRATYGWVPLNPEDMLPAEQRAQVMLQKADESFQKLQALLAQGPAPTPAPPAPALLQPNPEALARAAERLKTTTQGPSKAKRFHPLLAQGWRYCEGQLTSPEDIEMLGLTPDEDQSEKEQAR